MKIAIQWGRSDTFGCGKCKFIRGIFLLRKMSTFLCFDWYSPPSPGYPIKIKRDNGV